MSGNPFRRQPQQTQAPDVSAGAAFEPEAAAYPESLPSINTERRTSKVKRVRIATPPPLSPDSPYEEDDTIIRRVSNESHEGSPPPSPSAAFTKAFPALDGDYPGDPFSRDGLGNEMEMSKEVMDNTRKNSDVDEMARGAPGGIANPFQRTLATMDPKDRRTEDEESEEEDISSESSGKKTSKGQMDVDAFKRMLLMGDPSSTTSKDSPTPSTSRVATSSNVTRDGLNSYSMSQSSAPISASSDASPRGMRPSDAGQTAGIATFEKKQKPPPPKHRHGKLVDQQRTPQTVSFSDFEPTETLSPPLSRAQSKPLPQIPPTRRSTEADATPTSTVANRQSMSQPLASPDIESPMPHSESENTQTQTQAPQQSPPPPPLTRGSSQAKLQRQSLIRESSSSSFSSQRIPKPPSLSGMPKASPDLKPAKPPPPPPSRRPGAKQNLSSDQPRLDNASSNSLHEEPLNLNSSRSSSIASRNRISMPPPPPPRRRGSSKSSIDRPSRASLTFPPASSEHTTSEESLGSAGEAHMEQEPSSEDHRAEPDASVLDDMDRLQAEVDALRAKHGGNR